MKTKKRKKKKAGWKNRRKMIKGWIKFKGNRKKKL